MSVPPFRVPESLATVPAQGKLAPGLSFPDQTPHLNRPPRRRSQVASVIPVAWRRERVRAPPPSLAANAARPARAGAVRMRSGAARGGRGGVVSLSVT